MSNYDEVDTNYYMLERCLSKRMAACLHKMLTNTIIKPITK